MDMCCQHLEEHFYVEDGMGQVQEATFGLGKKQLFALSSARFKLASFLLFQSSLLFISL